MRCVLERPVFIDENLSAPGTDHESAAAQADFIRDALRDQRLVAITDLVESELARRGAAVKAQDYARRTQAASFPGSVHFQFLISGMSSRCSTT